MSELKPCQFCGGTNLYIDGYDHASGKRWRVVCLDCMATVDDGTVQQKYRAIEAWNRRAQPANEPLTLEQLREMDGEPVYIKYHTCGRWEIYQSFMHDHGLYGKTWLAYCRKLEPEGNENDGTK